MTSLAHVHICPAFNYVSDHICSRSNPILHIGCRPRCRGWLVATTGCVCGCRTVEHIGLVHGCANLVLRGGAAPCTECPHRQMHPCPILPEPHFTRPKLKLEPSVDRVVKRTQARRTRVLGFAQILKPRTLERSTRIPRDEVVEDAATCCCLLQVQSCCEGGGHDPRVERQFLLGCLGHNQAYWRDIAEVGPCVRSMR